ncbi:Ig domain-containing protein [Roseateles asaccharophilus]|uniref:Uncharacterized protein n=1 Tax=Roseateles asaccharophilus TaxID=582607 RepID=A0ABU2ABM1_9BURK|nr:Ig domain-containing protein [Roseateles asaccharophilus]MDR7334598.1 hypothetical protein [Roseateles asaccharophilus]
MQKLRFPRRRNDWADDSPPPAPATPAGPPCRHCARLRVFLAGVLLAGGLVMLHAAAQGPAGTPATSAAPSHAGVVTQPVPPRREPEVSLLPISSVAPAASAASAAGTLELVYQTVPLPSGRINQPYKPRDLVRGGRAPYRFTVEGSLPPGLALDAIGRLAGTPTATGNYSFELTVTDANDPPRVDRAPYVLRILGATPTAASPKRMPRTLSLEQADRTVPSDPLPPVTYLLTQAKLDALLGVAQEELDNKKAEAASQSSAEGEPPATKAPPAPVIYAPTVEQLREMLLPLLNVEHPTLAVFMDSLRARHCEYFLRHVNAIGLESKEEVVTRCPRGGDPTDSSRPTAPAASGPAAPKPSAAEKVLQKALASGRLPLPAFYDMLMPAATVDEIVQQAAVEHPLDAASPLQLNGDGCGCTLPDASNDVFAFLPYWLNDGSKGALPVRFDKFTRLQYMGVVLRSNGEFMKPRGWDSPGGGFARQADRHAVNVDLVLYRRNFRALMELPKAALEQVVKTAGDQVRDMLDRRPEDLQGRLEPLLPPGWRETSYLYDGVTVFFDVSDEEARSAAFQAFYRAFLFELVTVMEQQPRRHFHLNLVVPQHLIGEPGTAFRFGHLMEIMKRAEKGRATGDLNPKDRSAAAATYKSDDTYKGTGDISVRFLVPLGVGGDVDKMQLRSRADFNDELVGEDRMALLGSLVPVLLHAGGAPRPMPPADYDSLDRDLVYIGWSFGGVAFWPLPTNNRGTGEKVLVRLSERFWDYLDSDSPFCQLVCPLRMPLRLLLEALLLTTGGALFAYGWNCSVRRLGRLYLMGLWAAGIATLAVTLSLFTCDPALNELRKGNLPLMVLVVVLVLAGIVLTFRRQVEKP